MDKTEKKKVLVTYAVQGEFIDIEWDDVELFYVRTGIGKVKSAFHLAEAIAQVRPDLVLNIGTAGTITHNVGDILVCRRFTDRDMRRLANLGLEYEIDSAPLLAERGMCAKWGSASSICDTGDSFMTDTAEAGDGDVVDMESYAQAFVCREKGVPFISVKYVTDVIGRNSVKHWEDKLADARIALTEYFSNLRVLA